MQKNGYLLVGALLLVGFIGLLNWITRSANPNCSINSTGEVKSINTKKKGIDKIFEKILIGKSKYKIIGGYDSYNKRSVIVGDTETDILAGKRFGLKTVAVTNGMRNRNFLKKYKPDVLIDDFLKLKHSI